MHFLPGIPPPPRLIVGLFKKVMLQLRLVRHPPGDDEVPAHRAAPAAPLDLGTRGTIQRQGKQGLWLGEVGDDAAVEEHVQDAEQAERRHDEEHNVPGLLPWQGVAGGVLCCLELGLELLRGGSVEHLGGMVPAVVEGRVDGAHDDGRGEIRGQGFGNGGKARVNLGFFEDELREGSGVGAVVYAKPAVDVHGRGPVLGHILVGIFWLVLAIVWGVDGEDGGKNVRSNLVVV